MTNNEFVLKPLFKEHIRKLSLRVLCKNAISFIKKYIDRIDKASLSKGLVLYL